MTPSRFVPTAVLVLVSAFAVGCAAEEDEHPPAASVDVPDGPGATPASAPPAPTPVCTPHAVRSCKISWTDEYKIPHCMWSNQSCRADGFAWLPCGQPAPK